MDANIKLGEVLIAKKTCDAFPEQYDVFEDGRRVAYFRARHGYFEVYVPDEGGEVIYAAEIDGNGNFYDEKERKRQMKKATKAIKAYYKEKKSSMRAIIVGNYWFERALHRPPKRG